MITEIDCPDCPSKQITQKVFQCLSKGTRVDIHQGKNSDQPFGSPKYKRSIILLFSIYRKVTRKFNQTQHHHSTTITQSNLYKANSSRHYKCKGLFTEEFQSILEGQRHKTPRGPSSLGNA